MRILVLGGTAFLSAEIARQAVAAGHDVTCLARGSAAAPPDGATWLQGGPFTGRERLCGRDRGRGTRSLTWPATPSRPRRRWTPWPTGHAHWTFVSSCSVYADHSTPGAAEDAALLPAPAAGTASTPENYGESKSAIEQATLAAAGDKAHLCRAGLIGGPGRQLRTATATGPPGSPGTTDPPWFPDIPGHATQVIDVRDLAGVDPCARRNRASPGH